MARFTLEALRAEPVPAFLVDVVIRQNGSLRQVFQQCFWEDAIGLAENAFLQGLEVEIEESFQHDTNAPLEFDRQA